LVGGLAHLWITRVKGEQQFLKSDSVFQYNSIAYAKKHAIID
jgi:hypothetical protein